MTKKRCKSVTAQGEDGLNKAVNKRITSGAAVQPVAVTGDLVLEGGVTVRLAAPERMRPAGTLLTWTGACRLRGAESFTVEGDAASAVRVRLDTERKRLTLVPIGGSVLLVR